MKRNNYERPTMKVFELKHQTQLLQVSGEVMQASRRNYDPEEQTWGDGE